MKLKLNTSDLIFLYTDGVTEAANSSNVLFTADRLKVKLSQLHAQDKDVTTIIGKMRKELIRFTRGAPQSDDITMLALTYKGKGHE